MKKTWKSKAAAILGTALIMTGIVGGIVGYPIVVAAANEVTSEEELQHKEEQTDLSVEDIKALEDESTEIDERLKKIEEVLTSEQETNEEQNQQIEELKKQMEELAEENKKVQEELKVAEEATAKLQEQLNDLEKRVEALEKEAEQCCKIEIIINDDNESLEKIEELTKKLEEISKKIDESNKAAESKDSVNEEQKKEIEKLQAEKADLQKQIDELKKTVENKDTAKEIESVQKKYDEMSKKLEELKKLIEEKDSQKNTTTPTSDTVTKEETKSTTTSPVKDSSGTAGTTVGNTVVSSTPIKESSATTTSDNTAETEVQIRYPNKLTPKKVDQSSTVGTSQTADSYYVNSDQSNQVAVKTEKSGVGGANASVTENVDNANGEYPIHHRDESSEIYSADARQFVTFQTKSGKNFYLIINHDEESGNVLLLTEVSEADLMHMVEEKEEVQEPVKEVVKEEPEPVELVEEPVKEAEKSNVGTYLILILVIGGVIAGGYYLKVVKGKEKEELKNLEEPDDYVSEASDEDTEEEYESAEADNEDDEIIL